MLKLFVRLDERVEGLGAGVVAKIGNSCHCGVKRSRGRPEQIYLLKSASCSRSMHHNRQEKIPTERGLLA